MLAEKVKVDELLLARRQVREFDGRAVSSEIVHDLLQAAHSAPSVGNSKPWRIVRLESDTARKRLAQIFDRADAQTRHGLPLEKLDAYDRLNVGGFLDAPVQLSFFAAAHPGAGYGQGAATQPEAFAYSTVLAMHSMWLKVSELGLGFNWCSTLIPSEMERSFGQSSDWSFVGHAAIGHCSRPTGKIPKSESCGFQVAPELKVYSV